MIHFNIFVKVTYKEIDWLLLMLLDKVGKENDELKDSNSHLK